jgi:hypothetical protein
MKLSALKVLRGSAYSLKDCIYLLIGFENIPNVLNPGNSVSNETMKELADEQELAKMTTLFW